MKYKHVTALHDSDTFPRIFFKGYDYRVGYGSIPGYEAFGNRFYLFPAQNYNGGDRMLCALDAETAKNCFGVGEGDFD